MIKATAVQALVSPILLLQLKVSTLHPNPECSQNCLFLNVNGKPLLRSSAVTMAPEAMLQIVGSTNHGKSWFCRTGTNKRMMETRNVWEERCRYTWAFNWEGFKEAWVVRLSRSIKMKSHFIQKDLPRNFLFFVFCFKNFSLIHWFYEFGKGNVGTMNKF